MCGLIVTYWKTFVYLGTLSQLRNNIMDIHGISGYSLDMSLDELWWLYFTQFISTKNWSLGISMIIIIKYIYSLSSIICMCHNAGLLIEKLLCQNCWHTTLQTKSSFPLFMLCWNQSFKLCEKSIVTNQHHQPWVGGSK